MGRYSQEATKKRRCRNYRTWRRKAKERHGTHFKYKYAVLDFQTQKSPAVRVVCPEHGEFLVTPHNHLRFDGGGCKSCGLKARGASKRRFHADDFMTFFEENLADRLELLTEYAGAKEKITVRCRLHRTATEATPDHLMHGGGHGCDECAKGSIAKLNVLKLYDVQAEFDGKFPDHVQIADVQFDGKQSKLRVECERHGTNWVTKGHLTRSDYGCPDCGNEVVGYTGYKYRRLVEAGEQGKETWVGVMEVEVFGIRALKVGVTTRSLEARYKWYLKVVYFRDQMREIDAYLLEKAIARKFRNHRDRRIEWAGMRGGKRWSGDTECYWIGQKEPIIAFIKEWRAERRTKTPDYQAALKEFEEPFFIERQIGREKDLTHEPLEVVGIEIGGKLIRRFPSIMEAARNIPSATQGNISTVLKGDRRESGGYYWVLAKDFDAHKRPTPRAPNTGANAYNARPVIRLDTKEQYPTSLEAQRQTGVSASHITSVCRGHRPSAGNTKWAYLEDFEKGTIPHRSPKKHGRAKSVIRVEDGAKFETVTIAAKAIGVTVSAITNAMRRNGTAGGYHWRFEEDH